jgi:FAD:protein FMN transferase
VTAARAATPAVAETDAPDRLVAFAARSLGSALRLQVRVPEPATAAALDAAERAWARVVAEFDAVDTALSRFREDSELTALNRLAGSGLTVAVSWRLRTALAAVHRAGRITGGRFDARVLTALERIGERGAPLAGPGAPLAGPGAPLAGPGAPHPGLLPATAAARARLVEVPDAALDMGGIGKGLALRWAASAAVRVLPPEAGLLLEAGGDVVHAGRPPSGGWLVGIEDPASDPGPDADPVAVAAVFDGAIATSSVRVRHWIGPDGRPVHHLVDPRTGEPARSGLIAVTVAARDPAWAEVWSKALFLAGREAIGEEARSRGLAAWWVDDRGSLGLTPEARVRSAWVAERRLG